MRRSRFILVPIAGLAAAAALAACGGGDDAADGEIDVVTAFYPLTFATERVGGDHVSVTNLTPAGQEPHDLELSPSDIAAIEEAEYVVYLKGFIPELDAAIEEYAADKSLDVLTAVDTLGYDSTEVFEDGHAEEAHTEEEHTDEHSEDGHDHAENEHSEEATASEDASAEADPSEDEHSEEGHDHDEELEGTDPHVWLDPTRYAAIGTAIADGLAGLDDANADDYEAAAQAFADDLTALDAEIADGLAARGGDAIVTSHAAFGYLADRYGLDQVAISGLSPDQEPDTQRMAEVAEYVEANGVTTIFFETLVSPDIADTLAAETGARTAVLNPLEGLTDEQVDAGADYFTVMRENLAELQTALGAA
ncbi:zinc ABC transporter substrate-binding protein [Glycomyces sp. TRM65418]|uniref:metal ABC transporter solute-binding protein, Zn/Mn family n=1 Tax=Glycomyces sp. TRM65418 TaxID=2867006 RepID=UPI001CE6EECC|nr:zinc ABC transporter substrate-binding protein [Glycomyces sp. TRM65418]MCC3762356.1 zinc ABC transporter substrate-binding protein [Glycomyces sp. TRM65418]QZD56406.1 zinc ABC transporter substrate-binding protein [Glycomyces sp. TRM65418]